MVCDNRNMTRRRPTLKPYSKAKSSLKAKPFPAEALKQFTLTMGGIEHIATYWQSGDQMMVSSTFGSKGKVLRGDLKLDPVGVARNIFQELIPEYRAATN